MIVVYETADKKKYESILAGDDMFQFLSAKIFGAVDASQYEMTGILEGVSWSIEYKKTEDGKARMTMYLLY